MGLQLCDTFKTWMNGETVLLSVKTHKRFVQRAWSLLEEISPEILQLDLGAHVLGNLYFHFRGFMIHIKVWGGDD